MDDDDDNNNNNNNNFGMNNLNKLGLERGTSNNDNNCNFSNKASKDLDFVVISVKAKGGREIMWREIE